MPVGASFFDSRCITKCISRADKGGKVNRRCSVAPPLVATIASLASNPRVCSVWFSCSVRRAGSTFRSSTIAKLWIFSFRPKLTSTIFNRSPAYSMPKIRFFAIRFSVPAQRAHHLVERHINRQCHGQNDHGQKHIKDRFENAEYPFDRCRNFLVVVTAGLFERTDELAALLADVKHPDDHRREFPRLCQR